MALINQISGLVNDAVKAALGNEVSVVPYDTTNLVSMGAALADANKFDSFYKQLTNRIVKTLYFVRTYSPEGRHVLRDEQEYGAFVQKIYYDLPTATTNPTYEIPDANGAYTQKSPFDVTTTIGVSAEIFGGKGVWSIEFVRPIDQIKTAFTSPAEMAAFIDGIYVTAENAFNLELEAVENLAVSTGIAAALASSKKAQRRNLLSEYNTLKKRYDTTFKELSYDNCMFDADFLKFASKEINKAAKRMQRMSTHYNAESYPTFTPKDKLVVEVLQEFAAATASYLEADTYHKEMVSLPNYSEIPYWQINAAPTDADPLAIDGCIKVTHNNINNGTQVFVTPVIAVLRDADAVAAYFGERKSWEMVNPRSDVVIHGEKAVKGYGVDTHCNFVVFTIEDE